LSEKKGEEVLLFRVALLRFPLVLASVAIQSNFVPFQDFRGCKCDEIEAAEVSAAKNFRDLHSLAFIV
jgi:hypothetical protein